MLLGQVPGAVERASSLEKGIGTIGLDRLYGETIARFIYQQANDSRNSRPAGLRLPAENIVLLYAQLDIKSFLRHQHTSFYVYVRILSPDILFVNRLPPLEYFYPAIPSTCIL